MFVQDLLIFNFHLSQEIPEGSWYCSNCTCQVCGALAVNAGTLNSNSALKCSQCDKKCMCLYCSVISQIIFLKFVLVSNLIRVASLKA